MLLPLRPSSYLCQFIHNLWFLEVSLLPLQYIYSAILYFFMPYSFNVCKMHNRVLIFLYISVLDKTYCFIDCEHFPPLYFLLASGQRCTVMWVLYQGSRLRGGVAWNSASFCLPRQELVHLGPPRSRGTFMLIHTKTQYEPALNLLRLFWAL